uniref:Sodium channel protein n=1 Tax=Callorhinchus milii TaxID=7868 RepID=A0A4W3K8K7_CALMI
MLDLMFTLSECCLYLRFSYLFTFIYTVEVIIKVLARGFALHTFSYLRNAWNWLDFTVILLAYLTLAFPQIPGLSALRAFRALKMIAILPGLKTIIGAIFKSARLLMEVLLLMLFVLLIIALFGLQIFKGVLKHKCIKNLANGINITDEEWYTYIQNQSKCILYCNFNFPVWVNNPCEKFLYNTFVYRRCPTNFTCLPGIGHNPNNGYTNFDNIGWALITAFQLITLDYWENTYNLVLRASGAYYIIFFIVVVMFGAHYIVNLVLAVVAASYEKEAKRKQEAKEEEERILELRRKKEKMVRSSTTQKVNHMTSQSNNFSVVLTSLFLADEDGERQTKTTSKWNMFKRRLTKKFCSWTCCPAFLNIQHYLVIFVSHSLFEGVITICILINTLLLSIDYYKAPYSNALEKGNTVLSIIFVIEAILKITALNPLPYVQNGWNAFDFIIVLLSCLEWALSTINIPTLKLSMIRSLRMVIFKLAKNWRTLNILITIIFKSMREMGNLTVIVIIVIYIFTVIGMQLVGHDYAHAVTFSGNEIPRWNFTGFYNSFIMVFRILCGEWIEPLYDCMRCSKMYFCVPLFLLTWRNVYSRTNVKIQLALQNLDYFYTVFFNMEMVFKVLGLGLTNYFTNVWTLLDFFLVVVSTCFFILAIQAFKSLRSLRTLRALRPLRAISRWEGMRLVVNALVASIPSISNVMLVCLVFWLIFGIVGVQIFGGMFFRCVDENDERLPITIINNRSDCDAYKDIGYQWVNSEINFDNILTAYMALLQVATFEGWLEIMANAADTRGVGSQFSNPYSLFYFVAFIVIGTFFTLNLFIGIIIDNFNTMHKRVKGALVTLLTEDQRRFYSTFKRLSQAKPTKKIPAPKVCFDNLVSHKGFEPCTIGLITLNVLVMACDHYGQTKTFATVLNWFNIIFTALFTLEAVVKLSGQRLYYFTQAWNIFDFIVVILSIAGILLDSTASKKQAVSPTILRVFRIVRLARLLRLVRSLKGIRKLLFTLVISIPALFNIGLLLGLVMFIYAILGMNLFRDLTREPPINDIVNFETFGNSMMLLFRLTTAAAWNEVLQVMVHSKEQRPFVAIIYMTSYILCANIVIINMYVAVILENFHEAQEQEISGVTDEDVDMFYEVWSNFDPNATQFITYEQLPDFLHELKHPLQIPKPNAVKIAALNFPLVDGHKLHCLDVLKSLSSVVIGNIVETEPLKKLSEKTLTKAMKLFPIRSTMRTTTTTLMIRKEIKAALTIQKAFRKWQVRQCYKAAKKKHERSYSSLKRSLGSLRSIDVTWNDFSSGRTRINMAQCGSGKLSWVCMYFYIKSLACLRIGDL